MRKREIFVAKDKEMLISRWHINNLPDARVVVYIFLYFVIGILILM